MFRKVFTKTDRILVATGIALLLIAAGLKAQELAADALAGSRSQRLLEQVGTTVTAPAANTENPPADKNSQPSALSTQISTTPEQGAAALSDRDSAPDSLPNTEENNPLPGYGVMGVISIPSIDIELPVLDECTQELLDVSACRYKGELTEDPQRLIIAGHRYKSHFGKLVKLSVGDEVILTGLDGSVYRYSVTEITDISMYDHETLESGDWTLSLFTCNANDRSHRVLVRCK